MKKFIAKFVVIMVIIAAIGLSVYGVIHMINTGINMTWLYKCMIPAGIMAVITLTKSFKKA